MDKGLKLVLCLSFFGTSSAFARPSGRVNLKATSQPLAAGVSSDILGAIEKRPWKAGLEPADEVELTRVPDNLIEGTIPADLIGTLYRNGPGRIRVGDNKYGHWFDGDGFVSAATFTPGGGCYFRQKYLKGAKYRAQERVKDERIGARGVWTPRGSGRFWENMFRIPANPINTNVMVLNGKILALCEGGPPFEIDPVSLELKDPETFGGIKSFFSAHPKIDPDSGIVYNLGLSLGATVALNVMKVSPQGDVLLQKSMGLTEISMVHDFVLAGRYLVVFISPYDAPVSTMGGVLAGLVTLGLAYHWDDSRPTKVLIFDKETLELATNEISIPAASYYHFLNGWERDNYGVLEVLLAKHRSNREIVEGQFRDMYRAEFTPQLECETWRYVFDVKSGRSIEAGPLPEARSSPGFELPTMSPKLLGKKNRFAYVNSLIRQEGFADSVSKVDLANGGRFETHDFRKGQFAGEAVFIPRRPGRGQTEEEEDDGYLLSYVYDASRKASDLFILDAKSVAGPPLAVIHLPYRVPYQFHGAWTPMTFEIGEL